MPDVSPLDTLKYREHADRRYGGMRQEASSFQDYWKDLARFVTPVKGRFLMGQSEVNKGERRDQAIYNNHAKMALRTATAGMLAGVLSPSRPWFQFSLYDKEMLRRRKVKEWLSLFRDLILLVLNTSNFYNMAPTLLRELLQFGTASMLHVDDFEDVARFYSLTINSFFVAQSHRLAINTLVREQYMTPEQILTQFGKENVSSGVVSAYDSGNYTSWWPVHQMIEPNPSPGDGFRFPFVSSYYQPNERDFLEIGGYRRQPFYTTRWEATLEDIYATECPGMDALGDTRQLMTEERRLGQSLEKMTTPPMQGPAAMKNIPVNHMPGGFTTTSSFGPNPGKIEPLYNVNMPIQHLGLDIQRVERRIDEAYFRQLFLAISEQPGVQPKNQLELTQIHEERLLQLGPVLEQVHGEWLSQLVKRVGLQLLRAGILPPAPTELQGRELDVEFVSALALAQRAVGTGSIRSTAMFAGELLGAGWDVRPKFDADRALAEYADLVGAPPVLIVPQGQVEAQRRAQQEQEAQQQAMQMAQSAANTAKMASDAKLGEDNLLTAAAAGGGR